MAPTDCKASNTYATLPQALWNRNRPVMVSVTNRSYLIWWAQWQVNNTSPLYMPPGVQPTHFNRGGGSQCLNMSRFGSPDASIYVGTYILQYYIVLSQSSQSTYTGSGISFDVRDTEHIRRAHDPFYLKVSINGHLMTSFVPFPIQKVVAKCSRARTLFVRPILGRANTCRIVPKMWRSKM